MILWSPVPVNRLCILYPTLLIELKRWAVSSSTSNIMSLWWCWPQRTKWRSSPPAIKLVDSWVLFLLCLGCRLAASIIWRLSWAVSPEKTHKTTTYSQERDSSIFHAIVDSSSLTNRSSRRSSYKGTRGCFDYYYDSRHLWESRFCGTTPGFARKERKLLGWKKIDTEGSSRNIARHKMNGARADSN